MLLRIASASSVYNFWLFVSSPITFRVLLLREINLSSEYVWFYTYNIYGSWIFFYFVKVKRDRWGYVHLQTCIFYRYNPFTFSLKTKQKILNYFETLIETFLFIQTFQTFGPNFQLNKVY